MVSKKPENKYRKRNTRTIKNLFQEWQIPPWLRDRIPLIYHHTKLIAIVGYAI
jgi:tRNA(Ile)-lysidine synthase